MSTDLHSLPLFPLNMVLYPHARVQLHVFEDRYRQMIKRCIEESSDFGIVLIRAGEETGANPEPYLVGTIVRIVDVYTFPDGRYDLTVAGIMRFRIREIDESKPYMMAKVEYILEDPPEDEDSVYKVAQSAREHCEQIIRTQVEHLDMNFSVIFPEEPDKLSFAIANMLEMPTLQKQRLLETTDTHLRLSELLGILESVTVDHPGEYRKLSAGDLQKWISVN